MHRVLKAVIPAAGLGTRFYPKTKVTPKELLPVGGKPVLQYVVEEVIGAGIEEVIVVANPKKKGIEEFFRDRRHPRATFVFQEEPLGLGHAIGCASQAVGDEPFVVVLPDVLVVNPVSALNQLFKGCGSHSWGMLLERVAKERISSYGVIDGCEEGEEGVYRIRGAVEKPRPEEAPSDLAILGRYLLTPEIFSFVRDSKKGTLGEIQLTDAIDRLAKNHEGVGIVCRGQLFDVGTPEGLLRANSYFSFRS